MAISKFIPEVWAAALLTSLKKAHVYGALCNTDYEGDISQSGDTVRITSVGRPTIGDYVKNTTVITPEELTDAQATLLIDQAKYFAFKVDDVDKRQAKGDVMDEALREAAYALRDAVDTYIAGLYTNVAAANRVAAGAAVAITTGDLAYTNLNKLATELDEADVPAEGRWAVIPPWYRELLREKTLLVSQADSGSAETLRNGFVGRLLGFDLHVSNNAPLVVGDDYAVLAGYRGAISFAEQINSVEAYRPESSFSDALKGLHLYGAKVVRPNGIATLLASKT